jgi:hypothetical protein
MPPEHRAALKGVRVAAIGPRASGAPLGCEVVIDTGIAGIHEAGTAYRLDDVPLPLTPPLRGRRGLAETLGLLLVGVTRCEPPAGSASPAARSTIRRTAWTARCGIFSSKTAASSPRCRRTRRGSTRAA